MRSVTYLWPILLFACTDRPIDDSASGDPSTGTTPGSASATTPSSASDTTPGTTSPTSGPATTGPSTTGPSTTGPDTSTSASTSSGPSSTGTTDVSTGSDPSDTAGVKFDLPASQWPHPALVGCTLAAPPGTDIKGQTTLGPFAGDRAYFGVVVGLNQGIIANPNLLILSPGADLQTELTEQQGSTGPIVLGWTDTEFFADWIGQWVFGGHVVHKGMFVAPSVDVTITEFAGNWDANDPADPPRLVGTFAGDLAGSFDAVFCDKLNIEILRE